METFEASKPKKARTTTTTSSKKLMKTIDIRTLPPKGNADARDPTNPPRQILPKADELPQWLQRIIEQNETGSPKNTIVSIAPEFDGSYTVRIGIYEEPQVDPPPP